MWIPVTSNSLHRLFVVLNKNEIKQHRTIVMDFQLHLHLIKKNISFTFQSVIPNYSYVLVKD